MLVNGRTESEIKCRLQEAINSAEETFKSGNADEFPMITREMLEGMPYFEWTNLDKGINGYRLKSSYKDNALLFYFEFDETARLRLHKHPKELMELIVRIDGKFIEVKDRKKITGLEIHSLSSDGENSRAIIKFY
jgi:hypothetical protein